MLISCCYRDPVYQSRELSSGKDASAPASPSCSSMAPTPRLPLIESERTMVGPPTGPQSSGGTGPVQFRNIWVLSKTGGILEAENAIFADRPNRPKTPVTAETGSQIMEPPSANHYLDGRCGNGSLVQQIPFGTSSSWTNWIFTSGIAMPLQVGSDTVQLVTTINSGPNADYL